MTESKEAMQNTIKNLQAKSEHINKLEDKGSKAVVLQLGSHTIKMGFANERVPFEIRPFVAYRRMESKPYSNIFESQKYDDKIDYEWFKGEYAKTEQELRMEGVISGDNKPFKGKPKAKTVTAVEHILPPHKQAECVFGQEALWVEDNPQFVLRKPLQHGFFNIQSEEDFRHSLNDIENILVYIMKDVLKIPERQWNTFSCVVVVPDVFVRSHIKAFINMLFTKICFRRLYVHLQSIMACFGSAVSSACVLDIGHEKINVCCVDQGIILPKTLIRKNFGCKDISKTIIKLVNDRLNSNKIQNLQIYREGDLNQIDKVKQVACAIKDSEQTPHKIYEVYPIRQGKEVCAQFNYSDSLCIAANSFFNYIWNSFPIPTIKKPFDTNSQYFALQPDSEDYFQEYSGGGQVYDIAKDHPNYGPKLSDPFIYETLQNLIIASILSFKESDVRKRFASNILIVGGGAHLFRLPEQLISKVSKKIDPDGSMGQKAQLASDLILREIAPIHASWLGGTVIPKLDSLRDLWIERSKYIGGLNLNTNEDEEENVFDKKLFTRKEQSQQWGLKYLKQKIPFLW